MAKATKPKKEKVVLEETKVELPQEPIIETPEVVDEPPSVTLDEVKEVEEPVIEKKKEEVGITATIVEEPIKAEVVVEKVVYPISKPLDDTPMDQKIINFVESRDGEIKMNDFLKSLYGVPKFGEPATWLSQRASKELRAILSKLSNEGFISIVSNAHMKLGTFYYPDSTTGKTAYHNLNTVSIICVK